MSNKAHVGRSGESLVVTTPGVDGNPTIERVADRADRFARHPRLRPSHNPSDSLVCQPIGGGAMAHGWRKILGGTTSSPGECAATIAAICGAIRRRDAASLGQTIGARQSRNAASLLIEGHAMATLPPAPPAIDRLSQFAKCCEKSNPRRRPTAYWARRDRRERILRRLAVATRSASADRVAPPGTL